MSNELKTINKPSSSVKTLDLSGDVNIDVSTLSEDQVNALTEQHAQNMTKLKHHAMERQTDLQTASASFGILNDAVKKASESGASATITNTKEDSLGRTEVIIGNTDHASRGKLNSRQAGEKDHTLWIVGIIAVAVVLVAVFM